MTILVWRLLVVVCVLSYSADGKEQPGAESVRSQKGKLYVFHFERHPFYHMIQDLHVIILRRVFFILIILKSHICCSDFLIPGI